MKDKNIAGILALFMGGLGIHRFYLGQTGLGIFYLIFCWFPVMWVVGLIDAIAFFSMDQTAFDKKYNRPFLSREELRDTDFNRQREQRHQERWENRRQKEAQRKDRRFEAERYPRKNMERVAPTQREQQRPNPYKSSGIKKYKEYEFEGAIADFKLALEIEPRDIATHFNIACAYSLMEDATQAFIHLDKAVDYGFNDFQRIKEHDSLAFLRIQPEFEAFEANNFRLKGEAPKAVSGKKASKQEVSVTQEEELLPNRGADLLEQLKRLGDLKEKGLLTEEEFSVQKQKILANKG
ncbi:MAG TPA: NINE protein [Saprospiraceae bacterium]|mgnify:CR=1 FL=1|nr:NINE protein [Saprospiraceae bacterium]HMQ84111.1 NINE protein [Saprospiraceae bacterium]